MIHLPRLTFALTLATALAAPAVHADSLLWKATNPSKPTVVPPYTNQVSPFPQRMLEKPPEDQADSAAVTEALAEQKRMRDEAYSHTEGLIKSGRGFEPMLSGLRVGGMLDGLLGKRVLVNNQWIGLGSGLDVRRVRTQEMTEAINSLKEYDLEAATRMGGEVSSALSASSSVRLTVKKIEPDLLTLTSPAGQTYTLPISINNR
ncbi:MAG: hypothetical protein EON60_03045 [Alphaproteobacteria bacterium]|nr:MAG: hypothetical protein EON60_03045 [Alphaproteobacteria bacterium]